jgi:hypothetical protein
MKKIAILLSLIIVFSCEDKPEPDKTPPIVMITNIQAGAELSDVVNVTVDATDDDEVARVEFFVNGALSGTSESSEAIHTFNWDTDVGDNGSYQIYAKATDKSDNSASSSIITVNVINYRLVTVRSTVLVIVGYKIDNEGDWKTINTGESAEIEIPKNSSVNFTATTPTTWCGTAMQWDTDIEVADEDLTFTLFINNDYFLLYTKNNDKVPVDYTMVNKDLTGALTCYTDIPNDNVEYILGFYRAHTNSNIWWYMDNHPDYQYWYVDGETYKVNYIVPDASHTDRNLYAKYHLQTSTEVNDGIAVESYDDGYMGIPSRDESSTIQGGIERIEK